MAEPGRVRLAVYDARGREVAVLVDADREAGNPEAALDASALPPGAYVPRADAGRQSAAARVVVAR